MDYEALAAALWRNSGTIQLGLEELPGPTPAPGCTVDIQNKRRYLFTTVLLDADALVSQLRRLAPEQAKTHVSLWYENGDPLLRIGNTEWQIDGKKRSLFIDGWVYALRTVYAAPGSIIEGRLCRHLMLPDPPYANWGPSCGPPSDLSEFLVVRIKDGRFVSAYLGEAYGYPMGPRYKMGKPTHLFPGNFEEGLRAPTGIPVGPDSERPPYECTHNSAVFTEYMYCNALGKRAECERCYIKSARRVNFVGYRTGSRLIGAPARLVPAGCIVEVPAGEKAGAKILFHELITAAVLAACEPVDHRIACRAIVEIEGA